MRTALYAFVYWAIIIAIVTACNKEEDEISPDNPSVAAPEQAPEVLEAEQAERTMEQEEYTANAMMSTGMSGGTSSSSFPCATVSLDTVAQEAQVDFGNGCKGPDGKHRSGKMIIRYKGRGRAPGSERSIEYISYKVDSLTISGTYIMKMLELDQNQKPRMAVKIENGKLVTDAGSSVSLDAERTRTWISGSGNGSVDEEFEITGISSGISKKGVSFEAEITTPLLIKSTCSSQGIFYPVSGTSELRPVGKTARVIDYGTGNCDKDITVTIGRSTQTYTLP